MAFKPLECKSTKATAHAGLVHRLHECNKAFLLPVSDKLLVESTNEKQSIHDLSGYKP